MTREEVIAILRSTAGRDETRRVYYLRRAVDFVEQTISTGQATRIEAEQMTDAVAELAEEYFPGSTETFAIIYGHRLRRVMNEVFGKAS